ncbi:hypothetical protein L6270_04365 [Candidatus Parcubacteria bacterium]|nr:hypothetical protein [Patescibacteria group bacterium]MBU4309196.1 hypothetical protein [Patescibacteria group bacterium]MBU4432640.1 hypothetical protein [Patescibacteria group bacterium]MBU4577557.1 hypothetical protein [Patescibacteria group bacterium]MCG2697244.1 hypothetical protein [Candidatus Parcubacteria bacterium]
MKIIIGLAVDSFLRFCKKTISTNRCRNATTDGRRDYSQAWSRKIKRAK